MRRCQQKNLGFSLIELMVVISIVSTMATLGFTAGNSFHYKALQVEAKQNLRHIATLYNSYKVDNDLAWETSGYNYQVSHGSWVFSRLTTLNMSDDCNLPNPFGFSILNCARNHYSYWVRTHVTYGPESFSAQASLKPNAFRNYPYNSVEWNINLCHELCTQHEITDNGNGSVKYTACKNSNYENFGDFMLCHLH